MDGKASAVKAVKAADVDARRVAQAIVSRVVAAADAGKPLGDPRQSGCIATWAEICEGVADETVRALIPGIVRLLFRKHAIADKLRRVGLKEGMALQHEAIAPYVIAFRRMRTLKAGGDIDPHRLLAETRKELRELSSRFHAALDRAMALEDEVVVLRREAEDAREQARKYKKDATAFFNEIEDTRARALNKLKFALDNLRDAMAARVNDPDSTLVASASITVQSYYMVCEDLGRGAEALKLARQVLGDKLGSVL